MSATQRVKQGFLRLPTAKKCLLIASFMLMVSAVLPWYDNQNSFGAGENYLGIQGPLFMVGFLVLGLGALNFLNMFLPLFGKNFWSLKRSSGAMSMILGAQAALLLLVGNTVFLHPDFGTTANQKATGFGMTVAFLSVGTLLIAGWWAKRKEKSGEYEQREKAIADAEEEARAVEAVQPFTPTPMPRHDYGTYEAPVDDYVPVVDTPSTPAYAPQIDHASVDPLTLDPKERYRLLKQRQRQSSHAQNNLWGGGSRAYERPAYGADPSQRRLP